MGILPGQPLAEAQSLAQGAGNAFTFEPHEPRADRKQLLQLAESCQEFSPHVAVADETSDAFWLDVSGLDHLFGGEELLLGALAGRVQSLGWAAHIALADSFSAAWALARYRGALDAPLLCPPGTLDQAVDSLPVQALRLSPRVDGALHNLGLTSVGLLRKVSRPSLAARLGGEPGLYLDRLVGHAKTPLQTVEAPVQWQESWQPEGPVEDPQSIQVMADEVLSRLSCRLRDKGLGALRIEVRFHTLRGSHSLHLAFFRPTAAVRHWLDIFHTQLERMRLLSGVECVEAQALSVTSLKTKQLALFAVEDLSEQRGHSLAGLIDRLASRLGEAGVLRAELAPDPHPQRAFRTQPLVACSAKSRRKAGRITGKPLPARPIFLSSRSSSWLAVTVNEDYSPRTFVWQGKTYIAVRSWGPERIETGWWRKQRLSSDFYRVECEQGGQVWLAQDARSGRWSLQGWMD